MRILLLFFILFFSVKAFAQFAPQVGFAGCTAIHLSSPTIIGWADSCVITQSWKNILDTSLGKVSVGMASNGLVADNTVVSLGDKGNAVYYFKEPIENGASFDFAIFENGFYNLSDSMLSFAELALVYISEDGITYIPFEATCNIDTIIQIGSFGALSNASMLNNLAGKYIGGYGTPFDLAELQNNTAGININNIHYVKVVDVVGSLDANICNYDKLGQKINDPFPTPYASGGFDLDGLALLREYITGLNSLESPVISLYPNPAINEIYFICSNSSKISLQIIDTEGNIVMNKIVVPNEAINIENLREGIYFAKVSSKDASEVVHFFKR